MKEQIIAAFNNVPAELGTTIIASLPIVELRGAIPAGIAWGLNVWQAALYSVIGNLIPVVFILLLMGPVTKLLRGIPLFDTFFNWLFERTRRKFYAKHEKWGDLALIIFVAIPLPVTGAWTGSLAAWLFGIPPRKAFPLIAIGVLIAAVIVSVLSAGAFTLFA